MVIRCVLLVGLASLWFPFQFHGVAAPFQKRTAPPAGTNISPAARAELEAGTAALHDTLARLRQELRGHSQLEPLLPDVEVMHKAVHWALVHDEFFRSNEVALARQLLKLGTARAAELRAGTASWLTATGLVVRGFRSRIDGSVQPYGLVVPAGFAAHRERPRRLDLWLHGRDNHLTELKFISDRLKSPGEFAPAETFVLHPYGRYCNAFKFAGETDVFEALEHARGSYPVDAARVTVRGFSMGGAGAWHLAAHHGGFWAAAAPGAGFAETADYTKALAREPKPAWFEQQLWKLYDATAYAANLRHCLVLTYSGELDKQKQAADVMARAMQAEGLELPHLIGPGVEHKYEPTTKRELARRFDEMANSGTGDWPARAHLTTWTLRYPRNKWISVEGLAQHWTRADVDGEWTRDGWRVTTTNVTRLALRVPPELAGRLASGGKLRAEVDGQILAVKSAADREATAVVRFERSGEKWRGAGTSVPAALRKRPGQQGPIDDAFVDSFLVVRPTGAPLNAALGQWTDLELARATNEWRAQFRGDVRLKDDIAVTDADLAAHHLVLWGDPASNRLLARVLKQLPLHWDARSVRLGGAEFAAGECVPVLIYPNPLNPSRYVVLNSGFTFWREGAGTNARQTPQLPDYALLSIANGDGPASARVRHAGFFDEAWKVAKR